MANEPDNRKVVPGGDVEFVETTMRPDSLLGGACHPSAKAEVPSRSFVNDALHRYVEYVGSTGGLVALNKFDPVKVTPYCGYFAFDSQLRVTSRQIPKPELLGMLRTVPDIAFLLDNTNLAETLPERCDVLNKSGYFKNVGLSLGGDESAFSTLKWITGREVLIPACLLPLSIHDGERYHRMLGTSGMRPYYTAPRVQSDRDPDFVLDYDALGLSADKLKGYVEQTGDRNIGGFVRELNELNQELNSTASKPSNVATIIYNLLKKYHPELTV